ncbi:hypothetical protein GG344DRAFT_64930 [Lentinula edodes]|nr:hypothetical protein GG344DRAFT_64930 [Lentinula edodes]
MLYSIFFILPLLVPSLHASPINKLRARGLSYSQAVPPSIPKGSICFFTLNDVGSGIDVVQAPMGNLHSKLTGADIQLHGKEEFVCALKAHQSGFKGPSNRLCVLKAEEEKFNELEKFVMPNWRS